jgi:hypothetical protein
MGKYLQRKKLDEISKEINRFKSLDLGRLSIDAIKIEILNIILGHLRITYLVNPQGLVRGRKNINRRLFFNKKDLWYPNWDDIPKELHCLNRCNDAGDKMLYTATETDTTICELQLNKGDIFTLAHFYPKKEKLNAKVQVIGIKDLSKSQSKYEKLFNEHYLKLKKDAPEEYEKNILVDDFLSEHFQIKVGSTETWKYKITIAISQILLTNPDTVGLIYPSISTNAKGANIILKADFVDRNLIIGQAGVFEVVDQSIEKGISVKQILVPRENNVKELLYISWRCSKDGDEDEIFSVKCN